MNKTFCPLPWKEIASTPMGSMRLCCSSVSGKNLVRHTDGSVAKMTENLEEGWNSAFLRDVRSKMKAGEAVAACENCYKQEASGRPSSRNSWLDKFPDMDPSTLPLHVDLPQVEQLDLRLGNTCNLRCRMCGPFSSSAWAPEWAELGELVTQPDSESWHRIRDKNWAEDPKFWTELKKVTPHLKRVYLTGGEPFLVSLNKKFLKYCIEVGVSSKIELRYNTNGTIWDPELAELWSQFQKVKIRVSIDGLGKVNEYIRHPSRWQSILNNLENLERAAREAPLEISIACTVQAYNVFHLPEFLKFFEAKKLSVFFDVVHQPSFLSVGVLSNEKANLAKESLERIRYHQDIPSIIRLLDSSVHSEWSHFQAFTAKLDNMRNQTCHQVIPELGDI